MKRIVVTICLVVAGGTGMGLAAHPAFAASLCVGSGPACYSTIQLALSAAHNGDVIHLAPGSYPGPVTILNSVTILGAGAAVTRIQGGGPVVTIGSSETTSEPTVSIIGVTITGGLNTSIPDPSQPMGGGIWAPASATGGPGATVMVSNSVITGNRVRATAVGNCAGSTCAFSRGGGIGNWGTMSLTNDNVSGNQAVFDLSPSPTLAVALGGGIKNNGSLTVRNSTISDNATRTTIDEVNQFNRSGGGGGIDTNTGPLTMDNSTVSGNVVSMISTSTDPNSGVFGTGGGIHVQEHGSATIRDSLISGNSIMASAYTGGNTDAGGGGIGTDGPLVLTDSTVRDNTATATVTQPQPGDVNGSDGGAIDISGPPTPTGTTLATITGTTLSGNRTTATGPSGTIVASGGALWNGNGQTAAVTDSSMRGNTAMATTSQGEAFVVGGATYNNGSLTLRNIAVSNNTGIANGASGAALGGGIANLFGPPGHLVLIDSTVTHNQVTGRAGLTVQGGGVYNDVGGGSTIGVTDSVIAQNVPDQCFGC